MFWGIATTELFLLLLNLLKESSSVVENNCFNASCHFSEENGFEFFGSSQFFFFSSFWVFRNAVELRAAFCTKSKSFGAVAWLRFSKLLAFVKVIFEMPVFMIQRRWVLRRNRCNRRSRQIIFKH